MNPPTLHLYPRTLLEGQEYLLLEKSPCGQRAQESVVIFVAYTACPAVVVVQNGDGERRRCPRGCLTDLQTVADDVQGEEETARP